MKKIKLVWDALKEQLKKEVTPDKKKEYCEDAKVIANEVLNGVWLEIAIIGIDALEASIKTA